MTLHVPGVDDFRIHGPALGKIQDLYVETPATAHPGPISFQTYGFHVHMS
jgi:hypothetical protein